MDRQCAQPQQEGKCCPYPSFVWMTKLGATIDRIVETYRFSSTILRKFLFLLERVHHTNLPAVSIHDTDDGKALIQGELRAFQQSLLQCLLHCLHLVKHAFPM